VDSRHYRSGLRINFFRDFGLVIRSDGTRGRQIYAIGNRESAVYLSGVGTRRVILIFAISGSYSALYGVLLAGYTTHAYQATDDLYVLPAIAALVLGGTRILDGSGTFLGTIAGVILITLLQPILSVVQMPRLAEKSFTELSSLRCCCCTGGSALNKEMEKDKRMRAVVGRVGPLRDRPVGSGVGPWVAEERYRKPIGAYEPGPNHTHGSSVARRSRSDTPYRRAGAPYFSNSHATNAY
jgi:hypothetical protein